ncbi:MAG: phospholipid/cholesterol/gamma-HCH transport system substrate-binding protein [Pseudonocardiales bacterium]|jgi:phospholipid/cholesterol/gamma-HCH transport system substrate-binding protein|nr:phospholipid/cholesterol/gamma-HCH transport system substrate-binding protein [Pseudonocardiales bacterium]
MRTRMLVALVAAGALGLSGCGFKGLYSANLPGGADLGNHPFTLTAYFDDVLDLVPQSSVRVNDVSVGKVKSISLDGWTAKVTLVVNDSVKLPDNATAAINQTSLLGEKFVSLGQPVGQPSSTNLHNGSVIKLDHTRSAAEVEQVLGALSLLLNEGGLRQIKVIGDELTKATKGNESAIRDLLTQLNTFVGTLDNQKTDITSALDSIDKLSVTLNRQKQVLVDALDTFPQALQVLSQERGKLVNLLTSLDHLGVVATDVINSTQNQLVSSLNSLNPVLTQLKNSGDDFPQSLKILGTFPFPLGTTRTLVRGDYANLDAYLNLSLVPTLCGLSAALCPGAKTTPGSTKKVTAGSNSAGAKRLQPMIIGGGR